MNKLRTAEIAKDYVFHIKMAIVSAFIVLEKLAELFRLHELSPAPALLMQAVIIPLTAYYMDAPLEEYIAKYAYRQTGDISPMKTD